jgi:hypothetical protein
MEELTTEGRTLRLVTLLVILSVFLLVPLRIIAYGYLPPDDVMRHTAFAIADRQWGDVILLDPRFPSWMDLHPGWHAVLRSVHEIMQWDQGALMSLSILLAFWTFTFAGTMASGNPTAWLLACGLMGVLEPAVFGKLLLGRPLSFSMSAIAVLLFVWTRRQPLRLPAEIACTCAVVLLSISMHPASWYLWLVVVPAFVICRRWRTLGAFAAGWGLALGVTVVLNGWYRAIVLPVEILQLALLQGGTLVVNLATENQPTGGPIHGLLGMGLTMLAHKAAGRDLRGSLLAPDFILVVITWILGLYVGRFFVEWGLPAMTVWYTRHIADGLESGVLERHLRHGSLILVLAASGVLYLGQTADLGGRYTGGLRNPLMTAPIAEIIPDLPKPGGVLYAPDMGVFYSLFHRLPNAPIRYALAWEPGVMPADDLKTFRAIQTSGLVRDYAPWFTKMTPADRVLVRNTTEPEWPGMAFSRFYGYWIGRKVTPEGAR